MASDNAVADATLTNGPDDEPQNPIPPSPYMPQRLATAARQCRACGTLNKQGGYRCNKCGRYLPANQERRTTGETAKYQPAEVLMSGDRLLDAVVADLGGADAMSALERSLAAKLRDVDILLTLNKNLIVRSGLSSQEGRRAHDRYLHALDRFTRIAGQLGLQRRGKRVTTLTDYLDARARTEAQP